MVASPRFAPIFRALPTLLFYVGFYFAFIIYHLYSFSFGVGISADAWEFSFLFIGMMARAAGLGPAYPVVVARWWMMIMMMVSFDQMDHLELMLKSGL